MSYVPTITVDITRADLVKFAIRTFPRDRSNWTMWFVIAAAIVAYIIFKHGTPVTTRQWGILAIASVVGATAGLLLGLCLSLVTIYLSSNRHHGVLGRHQFSFNDHGLIETTSANETLIKWGGVTAVERTPDYIHIFVSPFHAHLLPLRSFSDLQQFDEFWQQAQRLVRSDPSSGG